MVATPSADDATGPLRELMQEGRFADALAAFRGLPEAVVVRRPDAQLLAATAATRMGELASAEDLAGAALQQFHARGDADGRLRSLNLLGVVYFERGRMQDAERVLAEALGLANQLGDSLLAARANNNLASALHLRGRPDEALGLYRGALLAYQRLGDRRGAAESYHNLGLIFRQLGDWRNAEDATAAALRHAELVGERGLLALATTGRAELMVERTQLTQARQELDRAERWAEEAGDEIGAAEVRRVRALAALRGRDYASAFEHAEVGRAAALECGAALIAAECCGIAALSLLALHRTNEAMARRAAAEAGFTALGAVTLLERLGEEWGRGGE
ncbi:MAG: tetratricopeptide repeat protein [Gemmatimonadales bacterium]